MDADAPENCPSKFTSGISSFRSEVTLSHESVPRITSFDIGSFDLVRRFVEQVVAKEASGVIGNGRLPRNAIDWEAVEVSVAHLSSVEQAIGRAVVIARHMCRDHMRREVFDETPAVDASPKTEDPFFRFSVADVVPDFGDESRYRTKVAKKVGRILGPEGRWWRLLPSR